MKMILPTSNFMSKLVLLCILIIFDLEINFYQFTDN